MVAVTEKLQAAVQHHQAGALDLAESQYREIIRIDPEHADALHLLGVVSHQRSENQTAVEFIRRAIAINGSTALYHSNLGACYRQLGKFDEACASFHEAIRIAPQFAGAHYNLGMALQASGRFEEAVDAYRTAIQIEPDFLDAWNNLGNTLLTLGRVDEAVESYRSILELVPDAADIHYNLAGALEQLGDLPAAESSYRAALRFNPQMVEAFNNLGAIIHRQHRTEEAIACFDKAIALRPGYTDAELNRAAALQSQFQGTQFAIESGFSESKSAATCFAQGQECERQGYFDEAAVQYRRAIEIDPRHSPAFFGLGFALLSNGRHEEARSAYESGLSINANNAGAWNNLGSIYNSLQNSEQAIRCFRKAIEILPRDAKAIYNLGNIHKDRWELESAVECYRQAISIDPRLAEAHVNLGVVLQHLGRLDDAVESHNRALRLRPADAETRFHRSQTRLMRGNFGTAWEEYEARWEYDAAPREFPQPVWDGSPLDENSLLIFAEQGVGDEIMFASCVAEMVARTGKCCIECDARLVKLFSRSFPLAKVVARPKNKSLPVDPATLECDWQIAMGSLPRFIRRSEADFPRHRRYLVADASQVDNWRARLAALGTGLKVGISWRGGHKPHVQQRRSISLDQWRPVLQTPGVQFVNLQYGDCAAELSAFEKKSGIRVHTWPDVDPLSDLDGFSAQISALDLVISVDNSTVHFAGAVGTPVWGLLHFSPNWRWMLEREDSIWYSSLRLFRQSALGDWAGVIGRVAREMAAKTNTVGASPVAIVSSTTCASPKAAENSLTLARPKVPEMDAEALHEKEKYEKAWSHNEYRRMSPGLVALESLPLIDMFRKYEVRTILDAGCGSGKLMQRLMTDYGNEFEVHGFDISENCLDPFFDGIRDK
ncbi:MAG: tetratricopeptide repeat protein, partial [Planctomycetaceae bacterium]